jgi:CDP-diacylglycerol--glycerol-3-phosphate 3-phosphatidyltransferase
MFKPRPPESIYSEPNIVTLVRLAASLVFFILAAVQNNPTLNFVGLGIHWLGDVLDGKWARLAKQETILGAEIDIIADRVETLFFYVNFLRFQPALYLPIAVYLVDFAFVDFYLSYQFVKFGIISPNYFFKVDRTVYRLNFSPVGKFCNSTVVTLTLIFLPRLQLLALAFACALIAVKVYSIKRLIGLAAKKTGKNPGKEMTQS